MKKLEALSHSEKATLLWLALLLLLACLAGAYFGFTYRD
jgi:hypothetical protein